MLIPSVALDVLYRVPGVFLAFNHLIAAESTRHGGVSPAPYASLNLGLNTADDAAHVAENHRRFFGAIGADVTNLASSHQVHGTEILYTTEAGRFAGYDALMTDRPGVLVGVSIADCVPILIYDRQHQAVAAIHAGWRGTVGGIVLKTLRAMQQRFGTSAEHCCAYVGTGIDADSFEVGPEVAAPFAPEFKRLDAHTGRSYVDLKAANAAALIQFGIPTAQIDVSPFSTVLNNDMYFSHRAEQGHAGRLLAVIGVRA